jgi:3-hydroxybutyryl-CoA dehydrogenase
MKKIAVIGAGTMGNGIAHVFAQTGFSVTLIDVSQQQLDKALSNISKNFDRQITKGILTEEVKAVSLKNIATVTDLKAGVSDADH